MEAVKKGKDRQEIHERIRVHSMEAAKKVKEEGKPNDLIERILNDKAIGIDSEELQALLNPEKFIGCAPEQVDDFINNHVSPLLEQLENGDLKALDVEIKV